MDTPASALQTVNRDRLGLQLVQRLGGAILAGTYPLGHEFQCQPSVCAAMGVGRVTLREALQHLERVGLLTPSCQGKPYRVADWQRAGVELLPLLLGVADAPEVREASALLRTVVEHLEAARGPRGITRLLQNTARPLDQAAQRHQEAA